VTNSFQWRIFPVGDSAITIELGDRIDPVLNQEVIARFRHLQQFPLKGMIEAIPAYAAITIFYDLFAASKFSNGKMGACDFMKQQASAFMEQNIENVRESQRTIDIPVCYDDPFSIDKIFMEQHTGLSMEEIVRIHCAGTYRVYMIGFLPGFAYMGSVDEKIAAARKPKPLEVPAGSVGIAGRQTGIYPLDSPGGWQIIGRTACKLFDPDRSSPVLLNAGDLVKFYSITKEEFGKLQEHK
jgi:inhibitor of KinA